MKKISKKYTIYSIVLIVSLLFSYCKSNTNGEHMKYVYDEPSLKIDRSVEPIQLNLSTEFIDFYTNVDSIQLIELETMDESLIGSISRSFIINDTLYVADYGKSKSIFAFDLNGKYLYKINKIGNGPGEYTGINMVQIEDNNIIILDWLSGKIITYDMKGNFLKEKRKEEYHPHDFIPCGKDKMVFAYTRYTKANPYQLVLTNEELEPQETALPFENTRGVSAASYSRLHKTEKNEILYYYSLCDTIYRIADGKISPKYNLSFYKPGEAASFYERTKNMDGNDFNKELLKNDFVRSFMFFELSNVLYINYSKGTTGYISLVSKNDYKSYSSVAGDMKKRISNNPYILNGHYKNSLLASIDESIFTLISKKDREKFFSYLDDNKIEKIKRLKNSENNPIVCIIHIKDDL